MGAVSAIGPALGSAGAAIGTALGTSEMTGAVILVSLLLSTFILVPGPDRGHVPLVGILCLAVSSVLAFTVTPIAAGWMGVIRATSMGLALVSLVLAMARDMRHPNR